MPGHTRVLDLSLPPARLPLLACILGVAACQSQDHAPFFDPNRLRGDGGQFPINGGADSGPRRGDGGNDGGSTQPDKPRFDPAGDPVSFDPTQIYVHGRFLGGNEGNNVFGSSCSDGGASGFADWSSKNDWSNPNGLGLTVALPCETANALVRIDGSITYEIAGYAVRLFSQDGAGVDGMHLAVPVAPEADGRGDPQILLCAQTNFRHWVSPDDGMTVCYGEEGTTKAYALKDAKVEAIEIPDGFLPAQFGYGKHVLVHRMDQRKQVGVWSPDDGLVELADLLPFAFEQVAAIRAQDDGFLLLVVERDEDPPALSRWRISHTGKLTKGPKYPSADGMNLDPSNCDQGFAGGTPLSGTLNPALSIDHFRSAGCECALDPEGAALCIARDTKMSQLILRFVPDAQEAEIVYRVEDDPFLIDFKGLVTGP